MCYINLRLTYLLITWYELANSQLFTYRTHSWVSEQSLNILSDILGHCRDNSFQAIELVTAKLNSNSYLSSLGPICPLAVFVSNAITTSPVYTLVYVVSPKAQFLAL